MSILNKLTEGIVNRDLQREGSALLAKWEKTGLLEGMGNDNAKHGMARLLENQAKELLREASSNVAGDVEGFASVAFPIVRRVFGSLIANDLVSVQPMSLPAGLIFFMDFQVSGTAQRLAKYGGDSLYGGGVVGQQITGGLNDTNGLSGSFYDLENGYSSPTASVAVGTAIADMISGTFGGTGSTTDLKGLTQDEFNKLCRHDPDFISGTSNVCIVKLPLSSLSNLNKDNLVTISHVSTSGSLLASAHQVRRLTQFSSSAGLAPAAAVRDTPNRNSPHVLVYFASVDGTHTPNALATACLSGGNELDFSYALTDTVGGGTAAASSGNAVGVVHPSSTWGLEGEENIPEIDIKVDAVSVTAITKKLKAKWTPELAQDLNAYHNLDAEVELTGILSEQIALEIDREILEDLLKGATASTLYWSRTPGRFLHRKTGMPVADLANESMLGADFTGTVSEWYETLIETINDVSAQIHRKTLRGGANFLVTSPEVANILEFTAGFRANITADSDKGTVGTVNVGSLSKKWDVYVDPYFPRNVILVGRKGNSFLESGYVYAPYVPLQVTPTIFGVEDFVPRKGVMTRYAKKMVRPDMYGVVVVADLMGGNT